VKLPSSVVTRPRSMVYGFLASPCRLVGVGCVVKCKPCGVVFVSGRCFFERDLEMIREVLDEFLFRPVGTSRRRNLQIWMFITHSKSYIRRRAPRMHAYIRERRSMDRCALCFKFILFREKGKEGADEINILPRLEHPGNPRAGLQFVQDEYPCRLIGVGRVVNRVTPHACIRVTAA
jgi:hypothetical protein